MSDYTVADVIPGFCRDVIKPHRLKALNADDTQGSVAHHPLAADIELARYGRADGVEEAHMLPETSCDRHNVDRLSPFVGVVFDSKGKPKELQAAADPTDDLRVSVGNAKKGVAETSLGVEYAGKKTSTPRSRSRIRPRDESTNRLHSSERLRPYCMHGPPGTGGGLEYKSPRGDVKVEQIVASSYESFLIAQSKPKLILVAVTAPLPGIYVLTEQSVATDHPAQIATSVIGIGGRHLRERASSHESMRGGEVRPAWFAVTGSGYELPAEIA